MLRALRQLPALAHVLALVMLAVGALLGALLQAARRPDPAREARLRQVTAALDTNARALAPLPARSAAAVERATRGRALARERQRRSDSLRVAAQQALDATPPAVVAYVRALEDEMAQLRVALVSDSAAIAVLTAERDLWRARATLLAERDTLRTPAAPPSRRWRRVAAGVGLVAAGLLAARVAR